MLAWTEWAEIKASSQRQAFVKSCAAGLCVLRILLYITHATQLAIEIGCTHPQGAAAHHKPLEQLSGLTS